MDTHTTWIEYAAFTMALAYAVHFFTGAIAQIVCSNLALVHAVLR
jgi:hypothetical protein